MAKVDLVIKNGRIIDPMNNIDKICDIAVKDGKIHSLGDCADIDADDTIDATGLIVTPGLIDFHVHCYEYSTPLGINPDKQCLARGVTTVVDAGSAGAHTLLGLRKYIVEKSRTTVLAFLHIASHGLAAAGCAKGFGEGGESDCLNQVDTDLCVSAIEANRDIVVGVKVRLTANVANNGANEEEIYRRAKEAARRCGIPVMIHHTFSTIPIHTTEGKMSCPGDLSPGDIYTHTLHGFPSTIINPDTMKLYPEIWTARNRGVLFDLGHGQGSFTWNVAELCAKENFWPDIISTDLHSGNIEGPAYDLATTMSKMLHIGMSLYQVINASTAIPGSILNARQLGRKFGCLTADAPADITLLKIEDVNMKLEDIAAQTRDIKQLIVPQRVWKNGKEYPIDRDFLLPNCATYKAQAEQWPDLDIKDATPPNI